MTTATLAPDSFRCWLLLQARARWDNSLRDWGDPSDLVQVTLIEAQQQLDRFDGSSPNAFAGWLRAILVNNLADARRSLRTKKRDRKLKQSIDVVHDGSSAAPFIAVAVDEPSPSDCVAHNEQLGLLETALSKLPLDQGEAVALHHLQGLTLEVIAERMGKTQPAVAGLLRRGLKTLRDLMGKRGEE